MNEHYFVVIDTWYECNVCMVTKDFDKAVEKFKSVKEPCLIAEWCEDKLIAEYEEGNGELVKTEF